jgi:hypothetical protein
MIATHAEISNALGTIGVSFCRPLRAIVATSFRAKVREKLTFRVAKFAAFAEAHLPRPR